MTSKQVVLKLYKNRGETPLECLERFRKNNPEYKDEKMTYAGRLDPLAKGVLLVLVGEECKNKEKYLCLDKEYEVDVLFGFATDTYDVLGIPLASRTDAKKSIHLDTKCPSEYSCKKSEKFSEVGLPHAFEVVPRKICSVNLDSRLRGNHTTNELLNSFVGRFSQKYPQYSSKNIKGILKARNNGDSRFCEQSEAIQIDKDVEIKSIELLGERTISKSDLEKYIIESVNLVKGDFRQKEILESWQGVLNPTKTHSQIPKNLRMSFGNDDRFPIVSIRVNCTSGTYMRSLANSIGEKVGIPALALNIKRTKISL